MLTYRSLKLKVKKMYVHLYTKRPKGFFSFILNIFILSVRGSTLDVRI